MNRRVLAPIIILAVVVVLALATGLEVLYRMSYALALALVLGLVWTWSSLRGVSARVTRINGRTEVGRYFEAEIIVFNNTRMPKTGVDIGDLGDLQGQNTGGVVDIPGKAKGIPGQATLKVKVLCSRRGVFHVGPVRLSVRDPLGFFRLQRRFGQRLDVVVHPAIIDIPQFQVPSAEMTGDRSSRELAYFAALQACSIREYVDGDGLNRVHWPSSAHHGKLMVKELDATRSSKAWIVVDMEHRVRAGHGAEATDEVAATAAASIARRLVKMGGLVGLVSYGDSRCFLPPHRGDVQLANLLDALAVLKAEGTVPLDRVLMEEESAIGRNDSIIIITSSIDIRWVHLLSDLARRHVSVCAVAIDPSGFDVQVDMAPFLGELSRQRVPFCLVRKGQPLSRALSAWGGPGAQFATWPENGERMRP